MTSFEKRAAATDILMQPDNTVFAIIDYQPTQINSINSMAHAELVEKSVALCKLMKGFNVPIVLSTVNVKTGVNKETIPQIKQVLGDIPSYDRTSINAWEDQEFQAAIKATGRKKVIIAALWTEACLTFPTLDMLHEGFEVYPVVDAVGGTSTLAHEAALRRVEQAGAQLTSYAQLACEFQRDWNRSDTARVFVRNMIESDIFLNLG